MPVRCNGAKTIVYLAVNKEHTKRYATVLAVLSAELASVFGVLI